MTLDLSDEEKLALVCLLARSIEDDRYPLSPRVLALKGILTQLEPKAPAEPQSAPRNKERPSAVRPGSGVR